MTDHTAWHARNSELLDELTQALASRDALKQQQRDMIHTTAKSHSPNKPKKKSPSKPPKHHQAQHVNVSAAARRRNDTASHLAQMQQQQQSLQQVVDPPPLPSALRPSIQAYRPLGPPLSPSDSQDTMGREIDAAIADSVAKMMKTPTVEKGVRSRISAVPSAAHAAKVGAQQQQAPPLTPAFLTAKRRNMHCELDEPGVNVPYPRHSRPRGGFFSRLLGCFKPPQVVQSSTSTTTQPRPSNAREVSPPQLQLVSEMNPLRHSLGVIKPGLAVQALADEEAAAVAAEHEALLRHSRTKAIAAAAASNPPTPRLGGPMDPNNSNGGGGGHSTSEETRHMKTPGPEASFESLEAEMSDDEVESSEERSRYRRTPMASFDGRPLAQMLRYLTPSPMPATKPTIMAGAKMAQASAAAEPAEGVEKREESSGEKTDPAVVAKMDEEEAELMALIQAMKVPLPPGVAAAGTDENQEEEVGEAGGEEVEETAPAVPAGEVRQTQVTLAGLLRSKQGSVAGLTPPLSARGRPAERSSQQAASAAGGGDGARTQGSHAVMPLEGGMGGNGRRNNSASPTRARKQGATFKVPGHRSAPVSPAKARREGAGNEKKVVMAGGGMSSPLRHTGIKPRMTKAAAARSEATQRLLESRKKREAAHLAGMTITGGAPGNLSARESKRPKGPAGSTFMASAPAVAPAAAAVAAASKQQQQKEGYQLPLPGVAKGGTKGVKTSTITIRRPTMQLEPVPVVEEVDAASLALPGSPEAVLPLGDGEAQPGNVPPRSPGFYQMLERLALGMSVDAEKVEKERKPKSAPLPLEQLVGGAEAAEAGAEVGTSSGAGASEFEFAPAVRESGSGGAWVEAPRAPSAAAAASASQQVRRSMAAKVDASTNTLLGQLLEMERSLTPADLETLRVAIRREAQRL